MNIPALQKAYEALRVNMKLVCQNAIGLVRRQYDAIMTVKGVNKMIQENKGWRVTLLVLLLIILEAAQWLVCLILAKAGVDVCRKKLF